MLNQQKAQSTEQELAPIGPILHRADMPQRVCGWVAPAVAS
jgi:hypothetical protein